jgi:hypothetical protein
MGNIEVEAYLRESKVKDRTRILSVGGSIKPSEQRITKTPRRYSYRFE